MMNCPFQLSLRNTAQVIDPNDRHRASLMVDVRRGDPQSHLPHCQYAVRHAQLGFPSLSPERGCQHLDVHGLHQMHIEARLRGALAIFRLTIG